MFKFKSLVAMLLISISLVFNAQADMQIGIKAKNEGRYDIAIQAFKPLLDVGYGGAQYEVGEMFEYGMGVKKNLEMASELYHKAAEQGYAKAQFRLSRFYTDGTVVKKNLKTATKWLKKSAAIGLAAAQFNLGVLYHNGEVVLQDYKEAFYWYKQAALQNFIPAQFNLALLYYEGKGTKKDLIMSYAWNTIAGDTGYEKAKQSLEVDRQQLLPDEIKLARLKVVELMKKLETTRTDMEY